MVSYLVYGISTWIESKSVCIFSTHAFHECELEICAATLFKCIVGPRIWKSHHIAWRLSIIHTILVIIIPKRVIPPFRADSKVCIVYIHVSITWGVIAGVEAFVNIPGIIIFATFLQALEQIAIVSLEVQWTLAIISTSSSFHVKRWIPLRFSERCFSAQYN
jgi:hypothetical protein